MFSHVLPPDLNLKFAPEIREPDMCVEDHVPTDQCPHQGMTVIEANKPQHRAAVKGQ